MCKNVSYVLGAIFWGVVQLSSLHRDGDRNRFVTCFFFYYFFKKTYLFFCLCYSVHEKKCISRGEAVAPATQSKLSRVSSGFGLSKLTGVRRNKRDNSLNKNSLSAQVHTQKTADTL